MKIKNPSALIISILIPLAVGSLSSLFTRNSVGIYNSLNKAAISPPSYIFPIAWTILYILMGISSYLIFVSEDEKKGKALTIYAIQLFFNFFWSIIFFTCSQYLLAFVWIIALILLIIVMIYAFYQISPVAAYLQIPYLLWCLFAAYLSFMVYLMN